jgi:hypothetical protein
MRLGHQQLTLGAPALVPVEQGARNMPWLFRAALRHVAHTTECVELPILEERTVRGRRRHDQRAFRPAARGARK